LPLAEIEQVQPVLKDEQAQVRIIEMQAGHGAVKRLQSVPGRRSERAGVSGAAGQNVHERRFTVEPIPGAGEKAAVASLAVP